MQNLNLKDNKYIKAVIFDMDGLMFDTENLNRKGWYSAGAKHGYEMTDEIIFSHIGTDLDTTRRLMTEHFIKDHKDFNFDELRAERIEFTHDYIIEHGMPLKKGLNELLALLNAHDFKIAMATSSGRELVDFYLAHADVKYKFEHIITWQPGMKGKPAPDIFLAAAQELEVKPEECLVLEDSYNGIRAAHAANMNVIMIPDLLKPTPEILKLADAILEDLTQVIKFIKQSVNKTLK